MKLFCILSDEQFHTLDDLADELGVSKRTIFFDLKELESFLRSAGAELLPKKGIGYMIDVKKQDVFRDTVEMIRTRFVYNPCQNWRDEKIARFYDVIALMLTAERYITNEQISERLYLAKSSIQMEFGVAQYVLGTYDLEINRQNRKAPMIVGRELNLRLCGLQLNEYYSGINLVNESDSLPVEEPFFFKNERGDSFTRNRRAVIRTLTSHHYGYCSIQFLKLIKYLCIAETRYKSGYRVSFEKNKSVLLQSVPQYQMAREIFAQLDGFEQNEEEILAFTQLMLIYSSPDSVKDGADTYGEIYREADELRREIDEKLALLHDLPVEVPERIRHLRNSYLCVILFAIRFGCERQFVYPSKNDQNGYFSNLMCSKLAYDIAEIINQKYRTELSIYYIALLHEELFAEIGGIPYEKKTLRALVSSIYGIENARIISSRITSMLPRNVDVELIPELPAFVTSTMEVDLKCDFLIAHDPGLRYRSDFPLFKVSLVPKKEELTAIREYALAHHASIMDLWRESVPPFAVHDIQDMDDMEIFLDMVSAKYVSGKVLTDKVCHQLVDCAQYSANARMAWIFINHMDAKESVFDIYRFDKPVKWVYENVQNVVVMSIPFRQKRELLRLISDFSYVVMTYPEVWDRMLETNSPDAALQQILRNI